MGQTAKRADFRRSHVGVGLQVSAFAAFSLNGAGFFDSLPHFGARLADALAAQFFKHPRGAGGTRGTST